METTQLNKEQAEARISALQDALFKVYTEIDIYKGRSQGDAYSRGAMRALGDVAVQLRGWIDAVPERS